MNPKFWIILEFDERTYSDGFVVGGSRTEVQEFNTKEELNLAITSINTENLVSLEVISGFTLTKRVV